MISVVVWCAIHVTAHWLALTVLIHLWVPVVRMRALQPRLEASNHIRLYFVFDRLGLLRQVDLLLNVAQVVSIKSTCIVLQEAFKRLCLLRLPWLGAGHLRGLANPINARRPIPRHAQHTRFRF